MATTKTNQLLPSVFQSDSNKKFLNATLDQLTTEPNLKPINGYIGRKFAPGFTGIDSYIKEPGALRADYQLEPGVVYKNLNTDKVEFVSTYPETLQALSYLGANVANQDNLWHSEYYTYDPKINLDAFINFSQYYWLPNGPDTVNVSAGNVQLEQTYIVNYQSANQVYNIYGYGTLYNPDLVLVRGGTYTFNINQPGHKFYIQTDPGTSGKQVSNTNLSSRQVLGVSNNGAETGSVIFAVPLKTAQDFYIELPVYVSIDLVTTLKYSQIEGQLLSDIINNYGGIDGETVNLDQKLIIFGTYTEDDVDWTANAVTVPVNDRYTIWQILLTPAGSDFVVNLVSIDSVPVNNKILVSSGFQYGNTDWYKTLTQGFQPVPIITADKEFLYYQDSIDETAYGRIRLIDPNNPNINVETDILGKTNYISPNGIIFSNGLKIKFDDTAIPSNYQNNIYYVEGVGSAIQLIAEDLISLDTRNQYTYNVETEFNTVAQARLSGGYNSFTISTTDNPEGTDILTGTFPNANVSSYIKTQDKIITFPYRGGLNSPGEHEAVTLAQGLIGVTLPGIYIYAPYDNLYVEGYNDTNWHLNGPAVKINGQDVYGGTPKFRYTSAQKAEFTNSAEESAYYYQDSTFITANAWGNVSGFTSYTHPDGHSKIIGFAADGYPIYGPFGYTVNTDNTSAVIRMRSAYALNVVTESRPIAQTVTVQDAVVNSRTLNVGIATLRAGMRITVNSAGISPNSVWITNAYLDSVQLSPNSGSTNFSNRYVVTLSEPVNISQGDTLTFEFLEGAFIEDYAFMPGLGTLDQFNGRYCVTPDFPNGTYAYFATQDNSGNPVYPYFVGSAYYGSLNSNVDFVAEQVDYITINRASKDLNPWSRQNRWFHQSIIEASAAYNNLEVNFKAEQRAKRPIIEYIADLQLYDFGKNALEPIDFYDTQSQYPLQTIEGKENYYADGMILFNGAKIVFANAADLDVRNKIYEVQYINPTETKTVLHFEPYVTAVENNTINIKSGNNYANLSFWFTGINWKAGQQKLTQNQSPYFDVIDLDDISFGSLTKYPVASTATKFIGTKIFNYKLNDLSPNDPVLNLPISYKSINNLGDIEFTNYYDTDTFEYISNSTATTKKINTGYIYKNNTDNTITKYNVWTKAVEETKQYQLSRYTFDGINNIFTVDVVPEVSTIVPNIKVYVNFNPVPVKNFSIYSIPNNKIVIRIDPTYLTENDKIDIRVYSNQVSTVGFYEIPTNLNYNSQNEIVSSMTLGSLRNHIASLVQNSVLFNGPYPGSSNLRDINVVAQGGTILQQSAPTIYSTLFLNNDQFNFVKSVQYAKQEYSRFKNKFLQTAISLGSVEYTNAADSVDQILKNINQVKNNSFPWYYSDLVPYGDNKNVIVYNIFDTFQTNYELTNIFTLDNPSNKAVLVYLNDTLLVYGRDYTFQSSIPAITLQDSLNVVVNDELKIVEYNDTDGCFIPETPTKLGLYPKYLPRIITDNTYIDSQQFIVGHDGSLTPVFNDFRDNLLLELEKRIFNNIKVEYDTETVNIYDSIPGKFRNTGISLNDFNALLSRNYLEWVGYNNLNYVANNIYSQADPFTYNYSTAKDYNNINLPGSWRACYRYYYDTEHPNTRPWEMLGFSIEPDWWQDTYGPAPYTAGNTILWQDLAAGYIRQGTRQGYDSKFERPSLLSILPVDAYGNLISPLGLLTNDYTNDNFNSNWSIGQLGPTELAWRNSSEYAFALQIAMAATKPAKYFAYGIMKNKYNYDQVLDQYIVVDTNFRLQPMDIDINGYNNSDGTIDRSAGYLNWITDYQTSNGIVTKEPLLDYVRYFKVNLAYRVAGFTSKDKLKVLAEQFSPNSINESIIVPDADFSIILHKSSPITRIRYSAVILEKVPTGFKITGYDTKNPYFTLYAPNLTGSFDDITVLDESVKYYNTGTSYRINITYGTILETKQQVASFLSGYSYYLQSLGFQFNYFDTDLAKIRDWKLSTQEFLFWTQQGWGAGTTIVLSPFANNLTYFYPNAIVDEVTGSYFGSRILNQNFLTLTTDAYTVSREDNVFNLSLDNKNSELIGLADLNLVQYEHVIIFKNITQFNDVIYEPQSGARQYRLKLVGTKTNEWNGSLYAPGFIYSNGVIKTWQPNTDYLKSDIVEYKNFYYVAKNNIAGDPKFNFNSWLPLNKNTVKEGLIANFNFNAKVFEEFYNLNTINLEDKFDVYSLGLIGYRNRSYLNNVGLDDSTQVKLYQGFIKNKGTRQATKAFKNIKVSNENKDLELQEEWAFRVGSYGGLDTDQYVEINLNEDYVVSNPTSLQVQSNNSITFNSRYTVADNIYKTSQTPWSPPIFLTRTNNSSYTDDIQTAGYVNIEDVDYTVFDMSNPVEIESIVPQLGIGQTIWTAKDYNQDWNVYLISRNATNAAVISIVKELNTPENLNQFSIVTNKPHFLIENDVVIINPESPEFSNFAGIYRIVNVPDLTSFVATSTEKTVTSIPLFSRTAVGAILLKLESIRLNYTTQINEFYPGWTPNSKVWINENNSNGWAVYNKSEPWSSNLRLTINPEQANSKLGQSIAVSLDESFIIVGQPGYDSNEGAVLTLTADTAGNMSENTLLRSAVDNTVGFGSSLTAGDNYFAIGSPGTNSGTGHVAIYAKNFLGTVSIQQILAPNTANAINFGHSISLSQDDNWLYVGAPESDQVFVYQFLNSLDTQLDSFVANGVGTVYTLPFTPYSMDTVLLTNISLGLLRNLVPYKDYVIVGNTITFASAPAIGAVMIEEHPSFIHVDTITSANLGTKFGYSLGTAIDGRQVVIGAPHANVIVANTTLSNVGSLTVIDRSVERFIGNGVQTIFNTLYHISGYDKVSINNEQTNNYSIISANSIQFTSPPVNGSLVEIETNYFNTIQKFNANILEAGQKFGYSVDMCVSSCSVYGGAPYQSNYYTSGYESGAVYTFINQGRIYGTITGTVANANVTVGHSIRINDFVVTFTGNSYQQVIADINNADIPGVTAANINYKVQINSDSRLTTDLLRILPANGTGLTDLGLDVFVLTQYIPHPRNKSYEYFGQKVKRTYNSSLLSISSKDATSDLRMTFDLNTIVDSSTTFDADNTRFVDPGNGAAWIYRYLTDSRNSISYPGQFTYIQYLLPVTNTGESFLKPFTQYGSDITIVSKYGLVGAEKDSTYITTAGRIYKFINPDSLLGWDVVRYNEPRVDIDSIRKAYVYSIRGSNIINYLDYIDPAKGKILGAAEQDITYKTDYDPAVYNVGNNSNNITIDKVFHWSEKQVGQVWWDLGVLRYIDYEQGSIKYRTTNWGTTFPGSSIDVYEWTESIYPPSQYIANGGQGIPKATDNSAYVTISFVDPGTNIPVVKYYYWVKNKTSVDLNLKNRTLPVATIANYIRDPKVSGIKYFAPIATDSVAVYNLNNSLSGKDRVLHIDYLTHLTENVIHNEYQLVSEVEKSADSLPENILSKIKDSLSRSDNQGNQVPDINLQPQNRYGISIRPRQSVFINQSDAIKELVFFANNVFSQNVMSQGYDIASLESSEAEPVAGSGAYNLSVNTYNELYYLNIKLYPTGFKVLVQSDSTAAGLWTIYTKQVDETWKLTRVQSYDTAEYWEYIDWYADGFDSSIQPTYTVNTIVDIARLSLQSEDLVKINNTGQGKWAIIQVWPTFITTVAIESGTIQFKDSLYDLSNNFMGFSNERFSIDRFDHNPNIEIRKIFEALQNNLFINQLSQEFINLFFVLVKYAIAEQKSLDWVFKTSFVRLNQITNGLGQPKIYSKQSQDLFEQYVNEVKPFRTVLREFIDTYKVYDNLNGYVADFDVPATYDNVLGLYRSPSGQYSQDTDLLQQPEYFDWTNSYKYFVKNITIQDGGSNYTQAPVISITGSITGDNARAVAYISNGVVTRINVVYPGSSYITTPIISISGGNGSGCKLYANLENQVVRKIQTTLTYDRTTYSSEILEWKANTSYSLNDIIAYNNNAYRANYDFTSGSTFSIELDANGNSNPLSVVLQDELLSANDRIQAYYNPTNLQPGKIYSLLQTGINYPGVVVQGQGFKESGGFDIMNFDTNTFDSVEFDSLGTPTTPLSVLDTVIESEYTDAYLGLSEEDITVDGYKYVDQYSTYAPEELIPGRTYDTLDLTVTTFSVNANSASYTTWLSNTAFYIDSIQILNGGEGYTANSNIALTFTDGGGTGAAANASTNANGVITSITISNVGIGYTSVPNVTILGSNTSVATFSAFLAQNTYSTFKYRIFKDLNDNYQYLRLSSNTTLSNALSLTANSIIVANSSILPTPAPNGTAVCSVTINGERIIYFNKDDNTNTLSGLIRGAYGTGANSHSAGSYVYDSGYTQIVPKSSNYAWTPNVDTILTSVTGNTTNFPGNVTYIRSNTWVDVGAVPGNGLFESSKTTAVFVRQN